LIELFKEEFDEIDSTGTGFLTRAKIHEYREKNGYTTCDSKSLLE